jgi:CitB family two-component system response regulator MalR/two-component system response regulator DctR
MYHTIIVEDDPMVASINRQYLASDPQFALEGVFSNGSEALDYLLIHSMDLVIVDYYMPIMNGVEFIRALHSHHLQVPVIMITAASSVREVSEVMYLGVIDYIVKPFTYERFRQALQRYLHFKQLDQYESGKVSQDAIDALMHGPAGAAEDAGAVKGIQVRTLDRLRECLRSHADEYLTSDEIAKEVGLSRITVRRYLNHLLENHELISRMDYSTGGRPSLRYCLAR